jgi:hypothetical protein
MSLLGLVRHMTEVERHWFRCCFRGERLEHVYRREGRPNAAFDEVDPARAEEDFLRLNQEWKLARQAVAASSLDDTFISERWGEMCLRWIYGHMIEEYARHRSRRSAPRARRRRHRRLNCALRQHTQARCHRPHSPRTCARPVLLSLPPTWRTKPCWSLITDHCPWVAENSVCELGETLQVIHLQNI